MICMLFVHLGCQSPRFVIQGKVLDGVSKSPIPEAGIEMNGQDLRTDFEGNFSTIASKRIKTEVFAVGFFTLKQRIKLNKRITVLSIELEPVPLNKVEVKWRGGYATIIDENGNVRCVRIPDKN